MSNIKVHEKERLIQNIVFHTDKAHDRNYYLSKIETNAREIENVPETLRTEENFIIEALQKNTLTAKFLTDKELNSNKVALTISLVVKSHKHIIKNKLQEEEFYFEYFSQKIKNGEVDESETYKNKFFLSKIENVVRVIKKAGFFKLKYLDDTLKDSEYIVDLFCTQHKVNQIWASDRIKQCAKEGGVEVCAYVKTKLFYEKMNEKFIHKKEIKGNKI